MEEPLIRYNGPATTIYSYISDIRVVCPKCNKEAVVTNHFKAKNSGNKLVCYNCNHTEKAEDLIRYKAIVSRNCDTCGQRIEAVIPNNLEKVKEISVTCTQCGKNRTYQPKNEEYRLLYNSKEVGDPVFNLPLWFQIPVKKDVLWAFNREHLFEIRKYVASKLRERQTMLYTTMVEKLPNFIKLSKNRDIIIRAIDKLAKK